MGDTHGAKGEIKRAVGRAKEYECQAVVQVGDFGFWEHQVSGFWFLEHVSKRALEADIPFYFIDGNHENHTLLRAKYGPGGEKHKPTVEGFWEIRPHLYYIPRGTRWEWADVSLMGVGGAYSIDKAWRLQKEREKLGLYYHDATGSDNVPHTLWWPEEEITLEEFDKVVAAGTADILFTHDCPSNAPFLNRLKPDVQSQMHRSRMDEIGRAVQPKLWFHGHMHEFYNYEFRTHEDNYAKVIGLECDGMQRNWVIFDTDELRKSWGT